MAQPLYLPLWAFLVLGAFGIVLIIFYVRGLVYKRKHKRKREKAHTMTKRPGAPLPIAWTLANLQGSGARDYQEDAFGVSPLTETALEQRGLAMVLADGMGGLHCGAEIAQVTVRKLLEWFMQTPMRIPALIEQVRQISRDVCDVYGGQGGCTLVFAHVFHGDLSFISIGDSDLYLLRDGHLCRMTRRHEYGNDLWLEVFAGNIDPTTAQNDPQKAALSSFIGQRDIALDSTKRPFPLQKGDCLLLCSDGISDTIADAQLAQILHSFPEAAVQQLEQSIVQAALPHQDNYTAIIAKFE